MRGRIREELGKRNKPAPEAETSDGELGGRDEVTIGDEVFEDGSLGGRDEVTIGDEVSEDGNLGGRDEVTLEEAEAAKPVSEQRYVDTNDTFGIQSPQAKAYAAELLYMWESTGDPMWLNQLQLLEALTTGEEAISDLEAIVFMESVVKNETLRKAFYGGGKMSFEDGGVPEMKIRFGNEKEGKGQVAAMLKGLKIVKRAINNNNVPLAAYLMHHELSEKVLAVVQIGGPKPQAGQPKIIDQIAGHVVKDFLDSAGWTQMQKWLRPIIGDAQVDYMAREREKLMDMIRLEKDEKFSERAKADFGNDPTYQGTAIRSSMKNIVLKIFNTAAENQVNEGAQRNARAATELYASMADYRLV